MICYAVGCDVKKIYARGMCRKHYSQAWKHGKLEGTPRARRVARENRSASCCWCGEPFEAVYRNNGELTQSCSKSCARRLEWAQERSGIIRARGYAALDPEISAQLRAARAARSVRKRRERLARVPREPYTLAEIAERDGYVCQICGKDVDMDVQWPSPAAPTTDHVMPIVHGGDDTRANVQLACFICNLIKHDEVPPELVGANV